MKTMTDRQQSVDEARASLAARAARLGRTLDDLESLALKRELRPHEWDRLNDAIMELNWVEQQWERLVA